MKYLEKKKKIICNHISYFCDSICSILLLRLTSLDPPENGIAINFGTTEFNVQPTEPIHQSVPIATVQSKQQQVIRIFFRRILKKL
jgi:hypothetical protein